MNKKHFIILIILFLSCSSKNESTNPGINIIPYVKENNISKIKEIYKSKVKVDYNIKDSELKKTPLHLSIENNNFEITNILLELGYSYNDHDANGLTPINYAFLKKNNKIIFLLGEKIITDSEDLGMPINFNDNCGKYIINMYQSNVNKKLFQKFLDKWLYDLFGPALTFNKPNLKDVEYLISIGANLNASGKSFYRLNVPPLYKAVDSNDINLVKYLINKGSNPNIHFDDEPGDVNYGQTPLMCAIKYGYNDIAIFLLNNGASFKEGSNNQTPLQFAIEYKNVKMENELRKLGATQ